MGTVSARTQGGERVRCFSAARREGEGGLQRGRKRSAEGGGVDHVGSVHDATFPMGSVKELRTVKKEDF